MRIAIIGAGNIGRTLTRLWNDAGHMVVLGVRDADAQDDLGREHGASVAPVGRAIETGEVVVAALPFGAWPEFAEEHRERLAGKVVLDATNTNAERDGAIVDDVRASGHGTLAYVQQLLPQARLVKAFNTFESHALHDKAHARPPFAHPIAGDDAAAIGIAARLVTDAGFDSVVVGDATQAKNFDEGTPVWNHPTTAATLAAAMGVERSPLRAAHAFLAAYAANDVDAMVALCSPDAQVDYIGAGDDGKGSVRDVGAPMWRSYMGAFEGFHPEIEDMWVDPVRATAIARVTMRGRQVGEVAGLEPHGRQLAAPHLFLFETGAQGVLSRITAWWDNATIEGQLAANGTGK